MDRSVHFKFGFAAQPNESAAGLWSLLPLAY